jgi:Mce-associated membrane protein
MSGKHSFRAFAQAEKDRSEEPEEQSTEVPEAGPPEGIAHESSDETTEPGAEPQKPHVPEEPDVPEEPGEPEKPEKSPRHLPWSRVLVFAVIPTVALLLAAGSAFFKWQIAWNSESDTARTESVEAAKDITVEMLSYDPETVEQHLTDALNRLTGDFRDSYTTLVTTRVIPIATSQHVTATAEVPAVGAVSATPDRAEVMLYVNQYVTIGDQAPQKTASTVRATMVRADGRWLMSEFEPVKP